MRVTQAAAPWQSPPPRPKTPKQTPKPAAPNRQKPLLKRIRKPPADTELKDKDAKTLTFASDCFSPYTLAYKDPGSSPSASDPAAPPPAATTLILRKDNKPGSQKN